MAKSVFRRQRSEAELNTLEANGFWRAIKLARRIGEQREKITLQAILDIHKELMGDAFPEIAGRFRKKGEDIKKLKCVEPPPGRLVGERIYEFWIELDRRLATISKSPSKRTKTQMRSWFNAVIDVAAWAQHGLSAIHPFCNGNGRVARLLSNVILRRFGLPPSRVKYEGDAREEYLKAMCQIDHHGDYGPLKKLIAKSVDEALREEVAWRRRLK